MNDGRLVPSKRPVDPIFPRFFKEGEDSQQKLLGLIAYGLYEEARREWADDFNAKEGRYPLEEELRAYERSWTTSRLDGLKNAAVQILASYAGTIAEEVETRTLRHAVSGSFLRSVGAWLFSAVLFTLAALGLVIVLSRSGVDVIGAFHTVAQPPGAAPTTGQ